MFGGESYISAVSCMELNSKTSRFVCLFNSSKGHGCGGTTALCGMHRHHYCMHCLTPPTSLCSDNMQTCTDQRWNGYQNRVASKTIGQCAGNTPNTLISTSRPRQTVSSLEDWRCCGLFSTCIWTFKNYLFIGYYVWLNNQLHFINTNLPSSPSPGQLKSSPSEQSTTHSLFWTHRSDPVGSHTPGWEKFSSVSGTPPIKVQTTVYYKLCVKWEDWGT